MSGLHLKSPYPLASELCKSGIFLAGGISNCPDWQEDVGNRIANETNANAFNPRRTDFDMAAYEEISRQQIIWEYHALRLCTFNMFWFPEETLCPITLFELGSALERCPDGALFVGSHPNYQRRFDLIEQANLKNKSVHIFDNLDKMTDEIVLVLGGMFGTP
jgi:hypothetical protein